MGTVINLAEYRKRLELLKNRDTSQVSTLNADMKVAEQVKLVEALVDLWVPESAAPITPKIGNPPRSSVKITEAMRRMQLTLKRELENT